MTRFFSALVGLSLVSMAWSSEARADHRTRWGVSFSTGPSYGYAGPSFQGYNGYGYAGQSFQGYAPQVNYGYHNHSRGHYDYYPGSYVRHHDHFHYVPPHAHYHRGGHGHHSGHGHHGW